MAGAAAQAMKRIPRIKFPQRHPKPSGSESQPKVASTAGDGHQTFFSSAQAPGASSNASVGGKASLQPKRTPVTDREIEAVLAMLMKHSRGNVFATFNNASKIGKAEGRYVLNSRSPQDSQGLDH